MSKPACGKHVTIANNASVRVSRCPCGMVHVSLLQSGVSVQMKEETLRGLGAGIQGALEHIERAAVVRTIIN